MHGAKYCDLAGGVEEAGPSQQFPKDDTEGEDIGARVDSVSARLLGGHVGELPLEDTGHRPCMANLCNTKVSELHGSLVRQEDVVRTDIAVNDSHPSAPEICTVGSVKTSRNLCTDFSGEHWRKRDATFAAIAPQYLQRGAAHIFHDEKVDVRVASEVKNIDQVDVVQRARNARLRNEHRDELRVRPQEVMNDFEGHRFCKSLHTPCLGQVNSRHPSLGERSTQDISADARSGPQCHRPSLPNERQTVDHLWSGVESKSRYSEVNGQVGQSRRTGLFLVPVVLLFGWMTPVHANQPDHPMLVVSENCADPQRLQIAAEIGSILQSRLVDFQAALARVRPLPTRLGDARKQVEAAQGLFYAGRSEGALALLRDLDPLIEQLPPGEPAWKIRVDARLLEAMIYRRIGAPAEGTKRLVRLLGVDPTLQLDPETYPPSMLKALASARRRLAEGHRTRLEILTPGFAALVFLDGHSVGMTPLALTLPRGIYRIELAAGSLRSFARSVVMPAREPLEIDVAGEASVGARNPPCLTSASEGALRAFAQNAGADSLLVIGGDGREVRLELQGLARGSMPQVVSGPTALAAALSAQLLGSPHANAVEGAFGTRSLGAFVPPAARSQRFGVRWELLGPTLGLATALAAVGGSLYALGDTNRARLAALSAAGTLPNPTDDALAFADAQHRLLAHDDALAIGLLAGSGGMLIAAALLAWLLPGTPVVVSPSPNGISVRGAF